MPGMEGLVGVEGVRDVEAGLVGAWGMAVVETVDGEKVDGEGEKVDGEGEKVVEEVKVENF